MSGARARIFMADHEVVKRLLEAAKLSVSMEIEFQWKDNKERDYIRDVLKHLHDYRNNTFRPELKELILKVFDIKLGEDMKSLCKTQLEAYIIKKQRSNTHFYSEAARRLQDHMTKNDLGQLLPPKDTSNERRQSEKMHSYTFYYLWLLVCMCPVVCIILILLLWL